MSEISAESVNALGSIVSGFLGYILSPNWKSEEMGRNTSLLKLVCVLAWKEAFICQAQRQLANIVSKALILRFQSIQYFLSSPDSFVGGEFEVIFVTLLHLTIVFLEELNINQLNL